MVFQSFGTLPEIQESTRPALCYGRDLPWISAGGFWRKRGKYPPNVSDYIKSLPSHLQLRSLTKLGIKTSQGLSCYSFPRSAKLGAASVYCIWRAPAGRDGGIMLCTCPGHCSYSQKVLWTTPWLAWAPVICNILVLLGNVLPSSGGSTGPSLPEGHVPGVLRIFSSPGTPPGSALCLGGLFRMPGHRNVGSEQQLRVCIPRGVMHPLCCFPQGWG